MAFSEKMKALRGVKEASRHDEYPRSFKESNQLYGECWKRGFYSIIGERHQNTKDCWDYYDEIWNDDQKNSVWIKMTDPFLNVFIQYLLEHQNRFYNFIRLFGPHRADDGIREDTKSHLGFGAYANPLYWATVGLVLAHAGLYNQSTSEEAKTPLKVLTTGASLLLLPLTIPVVLATLLTTYLWDLAEVIIAATSVTLSSAVWYPAKLAQLKSSADDDYVAHQDNHGYVPPVIELSG